MISRRNIRVKVMQVLYMLSSSDRNDAALGTRILRTRLEESNKLFIYLLHFIIKVAQYAETDAKMRASKHIVTAEDRNVNMKIMGNLLLQRILISKFYKSIEDSMFDFEETNLQAKKIYQALVASIEYQRYISNPERVKASENELIKFIFQDLMLPNENFLAHIEEHFTNWDDDAELLNQLMLNFLQKPDAANFDLLLGEEKWNFAKNLLQTVIEKRDFVKEMINPRLKNWDPDRIAQLDMIIMQMGVCEFLFFETIPPKVTINEYIDLAKEYSTQQSGQFVNGILDGIHKELLATDKIHKIDFKN